VKLRPGPWFARAALVVASLLVALVLVEGILQLGGLFVRVASPPSPDDFAGGGRRIVCVGDSYTYGLYLERGEAYPQRLAERWNAPVGSAPIEVLNLGYPGSNSSVVVREFPRILARLSPDVVILLVGLNDYWTVEVSGLAPESFAERAAAWIREHVRLHRVYSLLRQRLRSAGAELASSPGDPTPERLVGTVRVGSHEFSLGFEGRKRGEHADTARLEENLEWLAGAARAAGAAPVLMTYPFPAARYTRDSYEMAAGADQAIREAAEGSGVPLVDLKAVFEERCALEACDLLLFADGHPTARGADLVARTLVEQISSLLRASDTIEPAGDS